MCTCLLLLVLQGTLQVLYRGAALPLIQPIHVQLHIRTYTQYVISWHHTTRYLIPWPACLLKQVHGMLCLQICRMPSACFVLGGCLVENCPRTWHSCAQADSASQSWATDDFVWLCKGAACSTSILLLRFTAVRHTSNHVSGAPIPEYEYQESHISCRPQLLQCHNSNMVRSYGLSCTV